MHGCVRSACDTDCLPTGPAGARRGMISAAAVSIRTIVALLLGSIVLGLLGGGSHSSVRRGAWLLHKLSRLLLRTLGVKLQMLGEPRSGAALVVGNHQSFLDILVLAACTPQRQVAKIEVGQWPLIGTAARRAGAIFLRRESLRELPDTVEAMATAMRRGYKVQAFPEATTRCGGALGAFHRAAFQAAIDAAVVVAPVTIRYLDAAGQPATNTAFLGDEDVIAPIKRVIAQRGLMAQVRWLPAVPAIAGTGIPAVDRRVLADVVEAAVARDLGIAVVGRRTRSTPVVPALRSTSPSHQAARRASVAA